MRRPGILVQRFRADRAEPPWHCDCGCLPVMRPNLVTRAADAANRIAGAARGGAFDSCVRDFVLIMRTVPDAAGAEWDRATVDRLEAIADDVVERVEERIGQEN